MSLTVAVIGCGLIARYHFPGLEKAGVRIKWVCDPDAQAAGPWAQRYQARYAAEAQEVMADPEVDLVVVTTVSKAHKPVCLAAIRAGKAVICEKTLAENADDALEIVRAAGEKNVPFHTCYMKRYLPAVEKAKELLPQLGALLTTHIRAHQCWGENAWLPPEAPGGSPRTIKNAGGIVCKTGGGILICGGSHILDLILFFLGRPSRLWATMVQSAQPGFDLLASALLQTPSGPVHFEALAHPLTAIGFLRDGWDERIEISGTRGRIEIYSAHWQQFESKASLLVHYDQDSKKAVEYRFEPVSPFQRAMASLCRRIERGECQAASRLEGYEVDELIAHIQKSAQSGAAVDVDWRA
jgi:myo-inositol 2-dehydrogenase/D-chiro-inositol 1-dehydrogenase/scyllo-inositol 2-dehydrogenase (NAD+)